MDKRETLEIQRILSANIKRFRSRRGMSQLKFAQELGISHNFVSDIETGKKWISPATLTNLAEVLGVEVYELFMPEQAATEDTHKILTRYSQDIKKVFIESFDTITNEYLK
ncbi:helix-turn-helix domain-containing protein [Brucepastera parasyntrophica]|uniref:helix-turn-helix domain-containing protein n=1 Tax=Brucepastera parasyntrophica TaxID=2880008 RepID=UPI002108DABD|nr:helix-turn-helix transcriptional regulator [Brucepastera parasyntrophica]ULQ60392.1 helix-turn-helix domain-containing protein [Brucepastera parasyntrophica]